MDWGEDDLSRPDLLQMLGPASAVRDLLTAYFDEDWASDHGSWWEVVAAYAAEAGLARRQAAIAELDRLLATDATDEDVDRLLRDGLGSGLRPARVRMGGREVLAAIRTELTR
jgi:hypothetical protein